ncbi:MAG: ISAzo13 family transposase [Flavobacteriaceae bacterium]|jgi:hypothetical protein|nr:ISAzo13 family transposase [Flavobacteriaceae bacterium]
MNEAIKERIKTMLPILNEKQKRIFLASEAKAIGHGGITQVSNMSGVSRVTITLGLKEIKMNNGKTPDGSRCRKEGGGRKNIKENYPDIKSEIETLVGPYTKGNPENPLKYTSRSSRNIEKALEAKGYKISDTTISELLKEEGYSLQANRKELSMTKSHPDGDGQFEYINKQAKSYMRSKCPVLSIDAKKKEIIGNFKNNGREIHKTGRAPLVFDHDFMRKELGKATPYGIYDIFKNSGFVNIGISSDTAEFAVESIRRWWDIKGKKAYTDAPKILITADCGGSNGYRVHLWKARLQEPANQLNKAITVVHFPPGTSKWNKTEHRLFSFISKNWRGKPLISTAVIINLISATKTKTGLVVECVLDKNKYKTNVLVSDEEYAAINIKRHKFHGEWNYTISPQKK